MYVKSCYLKKIEGNMFDYIKEPTENVKTRFNLRILLIRSF